MSEPGPKSSDDGVTRECRSRFHGYLSDVVRLGGTAEVKELDADGDFVMRIATRATYQRDQEVMPGSAVIKLPRRPAN